MSTNVGNMDRVIRLVIPAIIILLSFFKVVTGTLALVLLIAGVILAITSVIGICPLYGIFGINTCKKQQAK